MKVATILGTRPEIIRLSRVIAALDRYTEHVLIHTGQNYDYELNQVFFDDLEIRRPDYFLQAAGKNAAETIGLVIAKSDDALAQVQPDAVLILGDTNSSLAALAAKRRKIPVFHMEAGNRCFDERVPEEINRKIVDHISDINMPYSDISREYLLREGIAPDRIIKTGSPMYEVLHHYMPKIRESDVLKRLDLKPAEYFVVSCHREENVDEPCSLKSFVGMLNSLAEDYRLRMVVSTHPRTRKRLNELNLGLRREVELREPFGFCDFVQLEMNAKATLSDSGTITEESSILGFAALNLREAHERPEGMEEAAVMMTGLDLQRVNECLLILADQSQARLRVVQDYLAPNVSDKVVRIIHSYVDDVNRTVWRKSVVPREP
jgi:UDP-N-acetylglucosamine 2-epimerase (non-hydrolysing)